MPQGLGIQLGLGGGRSATPSGAPAGGGYEYDLGTIDDTLYGLTLAPNLHLDASILDGADAGNNPSDGASVATWGDRSGNDHDFIQTSTSPDYQPVWEETWAGGSPAVYFDGVDDVLTDADFFSNVSFADKDVTMLIAYQPDAETTYALTDTGSAATDDRTFSGAGLWSSAFLGSRINDGNFAEKYPPTRSAAVYGLQIDDTGPTYKLYFNKREQYDHSSYISANFGTNADNSMKIGCGGTIYKLKGYIAEILVFNSVLSSDDWDMIHDYFGAKYNLSVYNNVTGDYTLGTVSATSYSVTGITPVAHFDGASNVFKSDGTAAADGESVALWKDKARDYYATQYTGSKQAVWAAAAGPPDTSSIDFDGTDDNLFFWMSQMLGDFSDLDGSAFIVFTPEGNDATFELFGLGGGYSSKILNSSTACYIGTLRKTRANNPAVTGYFTKGDPGDLQVAFVNANATANTYELYKNGSPDVFDSAQTASANVVMFGGTAHDAATIGSAGGVQGNYFNGKIHEVILFDAPLSDSQGNEVGVYLAARYGITWGTLS